MNPDMPQCYSDSAEPILRPTNNANNLQCYYWSSVANEQLNTKQAQP